MFLSGTVNEPLAPSQRLPPLELHRDKHDLGDLISGQSNDRISSGEGNNARVSFGNYDSGKKQRGSDDVFISRSLLPKCRVFADSLKTGISRM